MSLLLHTENVLLITLLSFKPHLQAHEIEAEVDAFEKTILYYADAYGTHGLGSQSPSSASGLSASSSGFITPSLSVGSSLRQHNLQSPMYHSKPRVTAGRPLQLG